MKNTMIPPCTAWAKKLAMAHPADLSLSEREELEAHLATCSTCTTVRTQYDEIAALLDNLPANDVPADLPPKLLQLWENEAKPHALPLVGTHAPWRGGETPNVGTPLVGVRTTEGGPAIIIADPPVFSQSNVYISTGSLIVAYRSSNGSLIRTYSIGDSKNSRVKSREPVIVNGIMYVIGTTYPDSASPGIDGIYALRLSDGAVLWHTTVGDAKILPPTIANALTVADGIVYVTINAHSDYLYALRASDGVLLWQYKAGKPYEANITLPVAADGVAYMGIEDAQNAYVAALNTRDGKLLWQRKIISSTIADGVLYASSPTIADGVLYASALGVVSALRIGDGSLLWQYHTGDFPHYAGLPTVVDGIVYVTGGNGYLYALRANDGTLLWNFKLGGSSSFTSVPMLANGLIYVGIFTGFASTQGSYIYALSVIDGHLIWRYQVGSNVVPALAYGNGVVYFEMLPKYPNQLYALRAGNGAVLWHADLPY